MAILGGRAVSYERVTPVGASSQQHSEVDTSLGTQGLPVLSSFSYSRPWGKAGLNKLQGCLAHQKLPPPRTVQ